jgi:hypothetical protein
MANITYTVIPALTQGVKVKNHHGAISHFSDLYAFALFLAGAARARKDEGVTVTVIDSDGKVLVGDVGELDDAA